LPATQRMKLRAWQADVLAGEAPVLELWPPRGPWWRATSLGPAEDAVRLLRLLSIDDEDGRWLAANGPLDYALGKPISRANELGTLRLLHAAVV